MKTQKQMWQDINKPKVEKLIIFYDENGNPTGIMPIVDRLPIIGENETVTYDSRWTNTQKRRK